MVANQLEPTSAVITLFSLTEIDPFNHAAIQRGIHDIDRAFIFASNPQFIFHDSPGFEAGDEREPKQVQSFIEKRARSTDVDDQLDAIWSLSLSYFISLIYFLAQVLSSIK